VLLNYLLAALSGALLIVVHPRFDLTLLAPFAIAPLVYALAREWVPKHRFLLGYVTGLVFWAGINYWIQFVISVHGGLGTTGGFFGFLLFVILRAFPLGVFGLLAGVLVQRPYGLFAIPALWVAIERLPWLFHYTWLALGNAGIEMAVPMRLAPITGVYGLSFLFAMLGTAVAWVALRRPRSQLRWLAVLLVLAVCPSLPEEERPRHSAATVQPNIPEHDNWTDRVTRETHAELERLTRATVFAERPAPHLVLWPEVPAPIYYFEDTLLKDQVNRMARATSSWVIIGTVAHNDKGAPLNAALMVDPAGDVIGRYDKVWPVPFGEYIPWPFKGLVENITSEIGDFEPGTGPKVFPVWYKEGAGVFICYESAFPHHVRQFTAAGATVLVNISNDGYFGGAAAREQHLSLVRMRAAENGRWVLRSTNDGITASIDPAGRIVKTLPEVQVTSGRLPYDYRDNLTFYARFGDVFAWFCVALAAIALIVTQLPSYRRD
jgi:apolipoprotein N-acyltransferase